MTPGYDQPELCRIVTLDDMNAVMAEVLNAGGSVTFSPKGISMQPLLIQKRDHVTISKPTGRIKLYDVLFYRRENGMFVLHRVVGKNKNGYILCGDNQRVKEYGITDANVIAVMTAFKRKGRDYTTRSFAYRLYSFFWTLILPVRHPVLRLYERIKAKFTKKRNKR